MSRFRAGFGLGYALLTDEKYGNGLKFGGSFYYQLSERLRLELVAQTFRSHVEGEYPDLSNGRLSVFFVHLSVQVLFPLKSNLIPYAAGGIGYYFNGLTEEVSGIPELSDEVDNALEFHFGGGIDYFFTKNIAVNGDLRFCIVKTSGSRLYLGEPAEEIENINLSSFQLAVGSKYFF